MRTKSLVLSACLFVPGMAFSQASTFERALPPPPPAGVTTKRVMLFHGEMGKWWKDSKTAQKLQLNEGQVSQLDQIFYEHKLKLIDDGAAMEKEDLKLQTLLDADVPNEGQINVQVDKVLAARGNLEREYTFMNLDLRKVLSLDQWRQLKQIRAERGPGDNVMYFRKGPMPGAPGPMTAPLPPPPGKSPGGPAPPPEPDGDDTL
jgi:Spy/CpxP family protein refolding chaperone